MKKRRSNPQNPLGIIALFVSLVEAMATISLKLALDADSAHAHYLIIFIVAFPVLLVLLFFYTLFKKMESFYSPGDFRDDESFLRMLNNKVEVLELSKRVSQIEIKTIEEIVATDLFCECIVSNDYGSAFFLTTGLAKVRRFDLANCFLAILANAAPKPMYDEKSPVIRSLLEAKERQLNSAAKD